MSSIISFIYMSAYVAFILLTKTLATHVDLALVLLKTLSHVRLGYMVLSLYVSVWPTLLTYTRYSVQCLHLVLARLLSLNSNLISLPFKTLYSSMASLNSFKEANSNPNFNLNSLQSNSLLNLSYCFFNTSSFESSLHNNSLANLVTPKNYHWIQKIMSNPFTPT